MVAQRGFLGCATALYVLHVRFRSGAFLGIRSPCSNRYLKKTDSHAGACTPAAQWMNSGFHSRRLLAFCQAFKVKKNMFRGSCFLKVISLHSSPQNAVRAQEPLASECLAEARLGTGREATGPFVLGCSWPRVLSLGYDQGPPAQRTFEGKTDWDGPSMLTSSAS